MSSESGRGVARAHNLFIEEGLRASPADLTLPGARRIIKLEVPRCDSPQP